MHILRKLSSKIEVIFVIAGAAILISLLFMKPFVGVADNGDFLRIMGTMGLNYGVLDEPYEDRFFSFSHIHFSYDSFFRGFYMSSHILLVGLARFVGMIFNGSMFDIRVLGTMFGVLLLTAGYTIIAGSKSRSRLTSIVLAALLLFVFFDIGYTAYFNSLFGEPVSLIFLLLTAGLGLLLARIEHPSKTLLVLFFISILFLVGSKTQNAPIGVGFALLGLRYAMLRSDNGWRKLAYILSAVTLLGSIAMYVAAPKDFKNINLYQTVFFGILKDSPDVEGDLKKLGLPQHLSVLANTNYFQGGTAIKQDAPSMTADFYDRISHMSVLKFYLTHPGRLISKMEYAAENGMMIRPYYLGSFEKSEGKQPGAISFKYSAWSEFKKQNVPNKLWFVLTVFAVYFIIAVIEWLKRIDMRHRVACELFILIGLTGLFSFLIPILGDGQADLGKHLFMFNVIFDAVLIAIVTWIVYQISSVVMRRS
ncbi:hypothetical protein V1L65_28075 [Paenibacillus sp. IITD108]